MGQSLGRGLVALAHCEKTETAISAPELLRLPTRNRPSLRSKCPSGLGGAQQSPQRPLSCEAVKKLGRVSKGSAELRS